MENQSLADMINSINNSIQDIQSHPTTSTRIPSTFEIMIKGVESQNSIEQLFSPQMDNFISALLSKLESGNFNEILENEEEIKRWMNLIFGNGSFEGPVSQRVLNTIQASTSSLKFQQTKSLLKGSLGKTIIYFKKKRMVLNQLKRQSKNISDDEEKKKYKEAVHAIKVVVKFIERIYYNRKLINKKVFNGLNNIVHEESDINEGLKGWD